MQVPLQIPESLPKTLVRLGLASKLCCIVLAGASVVRRAADAITNLAHENVSIKSKVRTEDGIPPLVALLEAYDPKVKPVLTTTRRQNDIEIVPQDTRPSSLGSFQHLQLDDSTSGPPNHRKDSAPSS